MTTANETLRDAIQTLRDAGITDPARDARLLLAHAMDIVPDRLTLHLNDHITPNTATHFAQFIVARLIHQPIAQIVGHRLFWGRKFIVTPDVLDPRPETETLITEALKSPAKTILDLGTGSGIILLSLLAEWPDATGTGADISPAALAVAQQNAQALGLTPRATFTGSNWFSTLTNRYDLITSNPPYIAADEMPHLSADVLNFEPHIALTPGGDGLGAYRAIAAGARAHLNPNGRLIVEIGPTQGPAVCSLFTSAGMQNPTTLKDLDGRDRVVMALQS
jgi:release factor glutamine methyltransferase